MRSPGASSRAVNLLQERKLRQQRFEFRTSTLATQFAEPDRPVAIAWDVAPKSCKQIFPARARKLGVRPM